MNSYVVTSDVLTAIDVLCARSEAVLREFGLTSTQYRILLLLETHRDDVCRIDCARRLTVSPATVGAAVAEIEARGLIVSNGDNALPERGVRPLLISKKGSRLLSLISPRLRSEYGELLHDLGPEHRDSFYTIFMLSSLQFGMPRFHPSSGSYDHEAALCSVFLANKVFITKITQSHGLSRTQYRVLYEVFSSSDATRMGEIAARLLLKPANLAIACSKLVALGMVEMKADRMDRRIKTPVLTKAGTRIVRVVAEEIDSACISRNNHVRPEETNITTKACSLIVARQQKLRKAGDGVARRGGAQAPHAPV